MPGIDHGIDLALLALEDKCGLAIEEELSSYHGIVKVRPEERRFCKECFAELPRGAKVNVIEVFRLQIRIWYYQHTGGRFKDLAQVVKVRSPESGGEVDRQLRTVVRPVDGTGGASKGIVA